MKKVLVIVILFFSLQGISQGHIRPIVFKDVSPLWQHLVVDSSRLSDDKLLGTKHLLNSQLKVMLGDSVAYFVYMDRSDKLQGAYIEKIDLKNGTVLWHNVFGKSDSGKREVPMYCYINENDEFELLCLRNSQENFYLFWVESHLSIRRYDINTGQLLEHIYRPDESLSDSDKISFFPGSVSLYPFEDRYVYFTAYDVPLFTAKYRIFDKEANFQRADSLKRQSFYISGSSYSPSLLDNNNLVYLRHSFNQSVFDSIRDENYDSMRLMADYYKFDDGLEAMSSIDLTDYLPYNWDIRLDVEEDNSLRLLCQDSVEFFKDRSAFVLFNKEGKYIETLDFGRKSINNLYLTKIPNTNNTLVFESKNRDKNTISIWKSDGKGNLNKIKDIEIEDSRNFRISAINILKDGTFIMHIRFITYDPNHPNGSSLNAIYDVVAFRADDIGIVNTISEEPMNDLSVNILPNPAKERVTISLNRSIEGIFKIYDNIGKQLFAGKLIGKEKSIDISNLSKGIYSVVIYSKIDKIKTIQFIKY